MNIPKNYRMVVNAYSHGVDVIHNNDKYFHSRYCGSSWPDGIEYDLACEIGLGILERKSLIYYQSDNVPHSSHPNTLG